MKLQPQALRQDLLDGILPVELPDHLFAKIEQRLLVEQGNTANSKWIMAVAIGMISILAINLIEVVKVNKHQSKPDLLQQMNLVNTQNSIYE